MGKTKTKIIDDSLTEEPKKESRSAAHRDKADSLVAKLNAELGIEGARGDSEEAGPRATEAEETKVKKSKKPGKATHPSSGRKPRSKKYHEVTKDLDRTLSYPLTEAIDKVKKMSYSKFNGTLEAHINTTQTGIRGLVSLPFASGKKFRILAFGSASKADSTEVIYGDDSTIEDIEKGQINFDIVIATPEWMPKLAKVARVLGPRGLMPNPKNGTITSDIKKSIENFQAGQTEYGHSPTTYKTENKAPVIHLALGKLNQPTKELSDNVKILLQTIGKSKIRKAILSPTMGVSVKLDLSSI